MRSSYKENNYGAVLSALIIGKKPVRCIELGVLDGYSTLHIALALKFNQKTFGVDGYLYCWDLFDEYKYKHGDKEEVQKRLDDNEVASIAKLMKGDAFEASQLIQKSSVDFLHVDISNDGMKLKKTMDFWSHRMKPLGIIAFEGGSKERDNVEWMIEYDKKSIRKEIGTNKTIKEKFDYFIMPAFPSMTILQKKGIF